ncbi:MAG: COX15/CtaA family protein [Flavobacteriales bacterium]|nr:COX15/CtaA family protein [Flavobacteriales bacterium]
MNKALFFTARISLVCIMLVVVAGSVVRMSGSGMGCPDWPKCFGYLIPPTERSVLEWAPDRSFEKGQMIIHNEALWVAQSDFTSGESYNEAQWQKYTRHNYALFNAAHTWTEYINRLIGAFSGIPVFLTFVLSLSFLRRSPVIPLLAFGVLVLLGFEAWLGKMVVDGNLIPGQITMHMFGALAIVALLLTLLSRLRRINEVSPLRADGHFRVFLGVAVLLSLIQILLGTQVREEIDFIAKSLGGLNRVTWIDQLPIIFKVHRSFSIVVLAVNAVVVGLNYLRWEPIKEVYWMGALIVVEVATGIALAYAGLPRALQPMHLVFSFLIFVLQAYVWLRTVRSSAWSPSNG